MIDLFSGETQIPFMKINGAIIKEQGVDFAIVIVKKSAMLMVLLAVVSSSHQPSTRLEPQIQFCEDIELGKLTTFSYNTNALLYYDKKAFELRDALSATNAPLPREYLVFSPVAWDVNAMYIDLLAGRADWVDIQRANAMEHAKVAADILRRIEASE